ncbi:MAG: hypothetical protein ABIN24_06320 [Dyadobacter sp.]
MKLNFDSIQDVCCDFRAIAPDCMFQEMHTYTWVEKVSLLE